MKSDKEDFLDKNCKSQCFSFLKKTSSFPISSITDLQKFKYQADNNMQILLSEKNRITGELRNIRVDKNILLARFSKLSDLKHQLNEQTRKYNGVIEDKNALEVQLAKCKDKNKELERVKNAESDVYKRAMNNIMEHVKELTDKLQEKEKQNKEYSQLLQTQKEEFSKQQTEYLAANRNIKQLHYKIMQKDVYKIERDELQEKVENLALLTSKLEKENAELRNNANEKYSLLSFYETQTINTSEVAYDLQGKLTSIAKKLEAELKYKEAIINNLEADSQEELTDYLISTDISSVADAVLFVWDSFKHISQQFIKKAKHCSGDVSSLSTIVTEISGLVEALGRADRKIYELNAKIKLNKDKPWQKLVENIKQFREETQTLQVAASDKIARLLEELQRAHENITQLKIENNYLYSTIQQNL